MAKLRITKIIRSGKLHSRVITSDGCQLILDNTPIFPFVGMELDIEEVCVSEDVLRPLCESDEWPELLSEDDVRL